MDFELLLMRLRAISESSRLRILLLCQDKELSVSEIVFILQQSQPRVSRHLKLLVDEGLLQRSKEGAVVFYSLSREVDAQSLLKAIFSSMEHGSSVTLNDQRRYELVVQNRLEAAQLYFQKNASHWQELRQQHIPYVASEAQLSKIFARLKPTKALDIGTGTGRILELLEPHVQEAVGIDVNREMLAVARSNLSCLESAKLSVKQGDMYDTGFASESFDIALAHMVLHFAEWPLKVLQEAARVLVDQGTLIIVDFSTHQMDELRNEHQHRWLGFDDEKIKEWCATQNLTLGPIYSLAGESLTVRIWQACKCRANGTDDAI